MPINLVKFKPSSSEIELPPEISWQWAVWTLPPFSGFLLTEDAVKGTSVSLERKLLTPGTELGGQTECKNRFLGAVMGAV